VIISFLIWTNWAPADLPLLSSEQILTFQKDGHILIRSVAPELQEYSTHFRKAKKLAESKFYRFALKEMGCEYLISDSINLKTLQQCKDSNKTHPPVIPYVQYINLHRYDDKVKEFAINHKFGAIAAELLQVSSIVLYQSTAFFKPPSPSILNQETAWHRDLNLVPIDTNNYLTMWCPLIKIGRENSILQFASTSHRDVAYLHWFPGNDKKDLPKEVSNRYQIVDYDQYEVGDCSFHHGWTFHYAKPNQGNQQREAIALSFVDGEAMLLDQNTRLFSQEDQLSYQDWIDTVYDNGRRLNHPLLPVVYSEKN